MNNFLPFIHKKEGKKRDDLKNRDVGDDDWCGGPVVHPRRWWVWLLLTGGVVVLNGCWCVSGGD